MSRQPKLGDGPHEKTFDASSPYMTSVVRNLRDAMPMFVGHNRVTDQDMINFYRYCLGIDVSDDDDGIVQEAIAMIKEQLEMDDAV